MGDVIPIPTEMLLGNDFAQYLEAAEPQARVIEASQYRDALMQALFAPPESHAATLPWAKTFANLQFRDGEVTLWAGANGSGKSMLLSNVSLGWMQAGQKVVVASFEMKPVRQLQRIARQFCMGANPSEAAVSGMLGWLRQKLWFYDQQGTVRPENVFAVSRYAADRLGAKHVIVDSLMKLVRGEDDYNGQKDIVDELTAIARDTNIHIHLVHHLRKPEDESRMPTKYDAKGAGGITDQVDNVALVWRNKPKEVLQARADAGEKVSEKELDKLDAPDAVLGIDKQRNGEWEGRIGLWYHKGAQQYCVDNKRRLVDFAA